VHYPAKDSEISLLLLKNLARYHLPVGTRCRNSLEVPRQLFKFFKLTWLTL
jgi:hypothetical protein